MPATPTTGDHDAILFEQLRPRLTAISRRIVGSDAEAEDVVQDGFIKWMDADRHALATPAAWLTTVVRHGAIDRLRRRAREAQASQAALDVADGASAMVEASPEDALLRRADLAEALARLLACLSPAERLALVLHEAFDCGHADIAALLGIRAATARQHVSRARRRLRAHAAHAAHDGAAADRRDDKQDDKRDAEQDEKRCRELVRRFQAAINGLDVPAMAALLAGEQPVSVTVTAAPAPRLGARACANDASYAIALAA